MDDKKQFREVRVKAFNPIYVIGLVWIIYGLIFPLFRITDFLIVGAISAIGFISAKRFIPEKVLLQPLTETGSLDKRCMEIIETGFGYIEELEKAHGRCCDKDLTDLILSTQINEIVNISRQMLDHTVKNPRVALELRNFIDYYFPETIKLLNTYTEMRAQSVKSDNIQAIMDKVHSVMDTIVKAFNKQLDNMFADKKLDIKTDIEVLQTVLSAEGLAEKSELKM
jgi:5-bromo-4-chloroindolyl phosphate hydrolysis protein